MLTWSNWDTVTKITHVDEFHSFDATAYSLSIATDPELGGIARERLVRTRNCKCWTALALQSVA